MRWKSARIVDLEEETNKNKPAIRTKSKRQNENENESKRNATDGTVEQAKIAGRAVWGSRPLTHWAIHRARKLRSYIAMGRPVLQRIETSASDGFYPFKGDEKGWFANHSLPPILNQRAVEMWVEQDVVGLQKHGNPTRSEVVDAWNPLVFTGEWVRGE